MDARVNCFAGRVEVRTEKFGGEDRPGYTAAQARMLAQALIEAAEYMESPEGREEAMREARNQHQGPMVYSGNTVWEAKGQVTEAEAMIAAVEAANTRVPWFMQEELRKRQAHLVECQKGQKERETKVQDRRDEMDFRVWELEALRDGKTDAEAMEIARAKYAERENERLRTKFELSVERTGVFATDEEREQIQGLVRAATNTPVIFIGSSGTSASGHAWQRAQTATNEAAIAHGLEPLKGDLLYGMAEDGEFVKPKGSEA
jgi:hypothetical protein